jgi:hypothetical protein
MLQNKQKVISNILIVVVTILMLVCSSYYSFVSAVPSQSAIDHHKSFVKKQDSSRGSSSKDMGNAHNSEIAVDLAVALIKLLIIDMSLLVLVAVVEVEVIKAAILDQTLKVLHVTQTMKVIVVIIKIMIEQTMISNNNQSQVLMMRAAIPVPITICRR